MTKYIPLGYHCNITFLSQDLQLKHETGLFEWLQSENLKCLTNIVNTIKDTVDTSIIKGVDKNLYIIDRNVFTYHYTLDEYKVIFERRVKRFLDIVKTSTELLFVRINPIRHVTTEEEINNFCKAIHSINSALQIKFLMIHTVNDVDAYTRLNESFIHDATLIQGEFLLRDCPDVYLRNNKKIQQQFLTYLEMCGVDVKSTSALEFDDKS
jgi:hypothetical protein